MLVVAREMTSHDAGIQHTLPTLLTQPGLRTAEQVRSHRAMSLLIHFPLPVFPLLMLLILPLRAYDQHFVFCLHEVSFFFIVACIA